MTAGWTLEILQGCHVRGCKALSWPTVAAVWCDCGLAPIVDS